MILGNDFNLHKYRLNREEPYAQSMAIVDCGLVTYERMLTAKKGDLDERLAVSHSPLSNASDNSLSHPAKQRMI